jgi:phosphonate transport system substrate-binding protein
VKVNVDGSIGYHLIGFARTDSDINGGVTWADGQGEWVDGYNSGALRKALPAEVKEKMVALMDGLHEKDADCAYAVAVGQA